MCLMQSAHLALIDALMAVGAMETVAAVKTRSAELLGGAYSWEDALLHWVNVVRRKPNRNLACFNHTVLECLFTQIIHGCDHYPTFGQL